MPLQLAPGTVALEQLVVVHVVLAHAAAHPVVLTLAVGAVPPLRGGHLQQQRCHRQFIPQHTQRAHGGGGRKAWQAWIAQHIGRKKRHAASARITTRGCRRLLVSRESYDRRYHPCLIYRGLKFPHGKGATRS